MKNIAYQYGVKAFQDGKKRIPAWDQNFINEIIKGLRDNKSLPYIKAWLKGWDYANLNSIKNELNTLERV